MHLEAFCTVKEVDSLTFYCSEQFRLSGTVLSRVRKKCVHK